MWFSSEFGSSPFHNWKNAVGSTHGKLNHHSDFKTHKRLVSFIAVMDNNRQSMKSQLSEAYDEQVKMNMKALVLIIDSI